MSRFEDQLKDQFGHFEPEVSPGVWEQISQQLPSAPATGTGQAPLSGAGKGLAVKMGLKGWIIAASLSIAGLGTAWYLQNEDHKTSSPSPESTSINPVATGEEHSVQLPSAPATESSPAAPSVTDQPSSPRTESNKAPATQVTESTHALTGSSSSGAGIQPPPSPAPSSSAVPGTAGHGTAGAPSHPQTAEASTAGNNQQPAAEPVLILSTRGGFAPLSVTAMSNMENARADFDFGDGHSRTGVQNASHTYTETGNYTLRCTVNGKVLEQTIQVIGQMPSAFSPNGDGVNDLIRIGEEEGEMNLEIRIYNRAGKLVFSAKGRTIEWDGRQLNGQPAETGTYIYDIFATAEGGASYKQKGTLHLFR
jgi:gliding motility-associated-like protein